MGDAQRLVLFIDYQNAYNGARDAFFKKGDFHSRGQFDPLSLGQRIASTQLTRSPRVLHQVRVYTGRPSSERDPKGYGAHMRQCAAWEKRDIVVRPRSLRYPRGWPAAGRAEEKGIDVQLAIDFTMMRVREEYDVGVILSTDTDLLPALEAVCELAKGNPLAFPEVAAWGKQGESRPRLRVPGHEIRCHWLDWAAYQAEQDNTDYNIKPQTKP